MLNGHQCALVSNAVLWLLQEYCGTIKKPSKADREMSVPHTWTSALVLGKYTKTCADEYDHTDSNALRIKGDTVMRPY